MRCLDRIRTSTLAVIAALIVFVTFASVSPNLPHMVLHAQQVGPGGVPGASVGGGAVSSVFGRTGAVTAATGDYTAAQVTNAAATNAANTFTASQTVSTGNNWNIDNTNQIWQLGGYGDGYGVLLNAYDHQNLVLWESNINTYPGQYMDTASCDYWSPPSVSTSAIVSVCPTGTAGQIEIGSGDGTNANGTIKVADLTLGGVPVTQAATAPSGSCSVVAWVLSNDGHFSFCSGSGGTWVEKF